MFYKNNIATKKCIIVMQKFKNYFNKELLFKFSLIPPFSYILYQKHNPFPRIANRLAKARNYSERNPLEDVGT
jgi:hypothetical protein